MDPDQPKSLPFSFKRQDPIQRQRNNSPKPRFFDSANPHPRANNNNDLIQTQSFRLTENAFHPNPSIKNSKPLFPSLNQAHPDPSQRLRQQNSQIARPIFGSHIKAAFKIEENASIQARQSSPLGHPSQQAHIPTFEDAVELDTKQYSPTFSLNVLQHPFPSLISRSSASHPFTGQQQSSHSNGSTSSYPVQNFPESPSKCRVRFARHYHQLIDDIQYESSHIRASSRASTSQSEIGFQSQSQQATPPQPHRTHPIKRSRSQSIVLLPIDNDDERNTSAALLTMTNNANSLRMAKFEIAEGVCSLVFCFVWLFNSTRLISQYAF
jgi:hypothetical protein